ncbi:MAG: porphobilinogen synthase [Pseudomonadota bacterium]
MSFPQTRLRRLRVSERMRSLVCETRVDPSMLVYPAFVVEGEGVRKPISSMPGICHLSVDELTKEVRDASKEGVGSILIFGVPDKKDSKASGATDPNGLVPRAVSAIREAVPATTIITDVCLCAYTDHGHCGVTDRSGRILNDPSLELLSAMALAHAKAGADIVAPSDMMDGRVAAIRQGLDAKGFEDTAIMSYAAKYASCFYGPVRDAAHSAPAFGDRRSYQMDPANAREAIREIIEDVEEGADIVMVKPAMPYLDIISRAREAVGVPLAAYQVSGEYAMIKAAAANGWLDERRAMEETLTAIRRAGADIILTYFARDFARLLMTR